MPLDVYFYEAFHEEAVALRRFLPPDISAGFTWKTIQEEEHSEPPARIISIRTQSSIPPSWGKTLSAVLSRSTGYDHIKRYLQSCNGSVPCGYLPLYCSRAVAEQAMLLWMSLLRKLPQQIEQFRSFHRDGLTGAECGGKTLLVVGVGNVGYEIVKIGEGLGMKALGVDIAKKHPSVSYISIESGLAAADVIVCAMNLMPENTGFFNYHLLRRAKTGALFVNIARGELSPPEDLLRLLDEGLLGGVALDVYSQEEELAVFLRKSFRSGGEGALKYTLALSERQNVIMTPHNAFNTAEAVQRKASQSVRQICFFLEKGSFLWPVPL